ncbi:hypothetical protein DMB44_08180 [Thermoplasma sp. Kam2015]|uniref:hypothetical protein n=1 Tax=Thermoplasma sp. Kam2015 TaxID=2094122 RepID=UPI000D92D3D1|nr:hypothetical protein [Thermoplasma sp. Kam2015]PYB67643.1 hypothetical protein DMB44_08180 [Thermoplasma sp. Kam2015]
MNGPEYSEKLDEIARIAVRRQSYMLRRSWGMYYAIWASGFTFMLLSSIIIFTFVRNPAGYLILLSSIFFIVFFSGYLSRRVFRIAARTEDLRHLLDDKYHAWSRRYTVYYWVIFILTLIAAAVLGHIMPKYSYYSAVPFLYFISYYVYSHLRRSFEKIPSEGYVSIFSMLAFAIALTSTMFTVSSYLRGIIALISLTALIASWFWCSIYALYHAREGLEIG